MTDFALILNAPTLDVEIKEEKIIAADGGYRLLGDKKPLAVIGDLDTLGYKPDEVTVITHPVEKDATDGELSLEYIKSIGGSSVTIYGALGGKIEHVLGNLNLLACADKIGLKAKIVSKDYVIYYLNGSGEYSVNKNSTVSLLPHGGACSFNSSSGLYYPLKDITIEPYSSLGISKVATDDVIKIEVTKGACMVILRSL